MAAPISQRPLSPAEGLLFIEIGGGNTISRYENGAWVDKGTQGGGSGGNYTGTFDS